MNLSSDYQLSFHSDKSCTNIIIEPIIIGFFFISLIVLSFKNHALFHTGSGLFVSGISIGIFVIALNTYSISKNKFLMLIGIGYWFVGLTNAFHVFTYPTVSIIGESSINISLQFSTISRYFASITFLISCLFLVKPIKRFNANIVFIVYLAIFILFLSSILYFHNFPDCYVLGKQYTNFTLISEFIIIISLVITSILYCRNKQNMNNTLYIYIQLSLLLNIIIEAAFINNISSYETNSIVIHFVKAISFYFMYKAIIVTGLKRPYALMIRNLQEANKTIDSKVSEVNSVNKKLIDTVNRSKEIEQILIDNEIFFELLSDNSPIAISVHSEGKFIFANKKACELLGTDTPKDVVGRNILDFIPEYNRELVREFIDRMYKNVEKSQISANIQVAESQCLRADDKIIDVSAATVEFIYKGKPANLNFTWDISSSKEVETLRQDVSEKNKLLDESLEFNKTLVEFFSNISHEFKTPLNVILGAIQVLTLNNEHSNNIDINEKLDKYLKIMRQNCFRLLRLVNNLIDLSKSDSGDLRLNLRNYNIVSVVEDIALSVADYIENKGIEIIFDTDTEDKTMAIDADKIERILLNLLSNAIKFTKEDGQILVSIFDKDDKVHISVKDTGTGIPEDKLNIIFDRFGQVDRTLSRNREGSGIGLSLVRSFVHMHGGTINVKSKFGEGSEFTIELPVHLVEDDYEVVEVKLYQSKVERINIEFSDIYS